MKKNRKPLDIIAGIIGVISFIISGSVSLIVALGYIKNLIDGNFFTNNTLGILISINTVASIFGFVLSNRDNTKYYVLASMFVGLSSLLILAIPSLAMSSFQAGFIEGFIYTIGIFGIIGAASLFVRSRVIA